MLYFAYGSNISSARLRTRVGDVGIEGLAWLPRHEHRFSKRGRDGTGKGNIEPHPRRDVHGVLYALSASQLTTLATFEGGYREAEITVRCSSGATFMALTFVALHPGNAPPPSARYLDHYRNGFCEHAFPPPYARALLRDAGDERPLTLRSSSSSQ